MILGYVEADKERFGFEPICTVPSEQGMPSDRPPAVLDRPGTGRAGDRRLGPTCDSADIMYRHHRYELPLTLTGGDRLDVLSAGACTSAYCTDGFNGFSPMPVHCLPPSVPIRSLAVGDQEAGELPHVLRGRRGGAVSGEDVHAGP